MRITKSGTAAAERAAAGPNATTRPRMRLNQATTLFLVTGRYWVVDGLESDLADQRTSRLVLEGRYLGLRRSYVQGRQRRPDLCRGTLDAVLTTIRRRSTQVRLEYRYPYVETSGCGPWGLRGEEGP
jgi:hypothetical protein